jgi:hypothetical protein
LLRIGAAISAVAFACVAYVYVTLPDVRILAKRNPKTTAFMELREQEAPRAAVRSATISLSHPISQSVKRAVAEDATKASTRAAEDFDQRISNAASYPRRKVDHAATREESLSLSVADPPETAS